MLACLFPLATWSQPVPGRAEVAARLEAALTRIEAIARTPREATEAGRLGAADLRTELIALAQLEALYLTGGQSVDMPAEWGWASLYLNRSRLDSERRIQVAIQASRQLRTMLGLFSWQARHAGADLGRMERILAREEFAEAAGEESALSAVTRRVRAWLAGFFSRFRLDADHPTLRMTYQFVFILALVGIVAVAVALIWRFWARRSRPAEVAKADVQVEPLPDSRELSRRRQEAQQQGRLREALHFAYLAFVAALWEREIMPAAAGRTNWEILRLLSRERRGSPALLRLESVNRLYDRVWYGRETCREVEVHAALSEIDLALGELLA